MNSVDSVKSSSTEFLSDDEKIHVQVVHGNCNVWCIGYSLERVIVYMCVTFVLVAWILNGR